MANLSVSTQIRTMYSDNMAYLNIRFFNMNLSFSLYPFITKDANGKSTYDMKNGQQTTVTPEGAYALYEVSKEIINGKIQETNVSIPCAGGASLTLERKLAVNGSMETVFSISKNNVTIPFRFPTITQQVKENGQISTKTIEYGLGAFMKTIEGYLTGINADHHLNKYTEEYAKTQEANPSSNATSNNGNSYQNYGNNNRGGNGYRQNYGRGGNNYRNNNGGNRYRDYNNPSQGNNAYGRQQNMSTFEPRN